MKKHEIGSKSHFDDELRLTLLGYLSKGLSIPEIAKIMGFNKTSIYRELILNSIVENKHHTFMTTRGFKNCKNVKYCIEKGIKKCPDRCMKYLAKTCDKIKKPFQICNFCERRKGCKFERLIYHYEKANDLARERFAVPRIKIKLSKEELTKFDEYFSNKVINGQSPEVIKSYSNNTDFPICSKTARNYIQKKLLSCNLMDLHRQVRYKVEYNYRHKKTYTKNPLAKIGHMYSDFVELMKAKPDAEYFEVDTVHGKQGDKKTLLTIHSKRHHFQYYVLLKQNTSEEVLKAFIAIKNKIGTKLFKEIFGILLFDNGVEFDNITNIANLEDGEVLTMIYYTRTYKASDKAECERNHEIFRYIREKHKTFEDLTEEDVVIINNNINSYPRKSLNWKTPIESIGGKFGFEFLEKLGIKKIEKKDVVLRPSLLKK